MKEKIKMNPRTGWKRTRGIVWATTYHSQWCRQQGYCSVCGPKQGVETFLWDEQKANLRGSAKPGIGNIRIDTSDFQAHGNVFEIVLKNSFVYCGFIDMHVKLLQGKVVLALPACLWEHHHDMLHPHIAHKQYTVKSMFCWPGICI